MSKPGTEALRQMFGCMVMIDACDQALRDAISAGQVNVTYYSPRGQEAVAAGAGAALRPDDYMVTTYRGMHDQIAKGVPLRPLLAEMMGRGVGTSKGKGGPMHISWPDSGLMLSTGVVGSGLPVACGLAWEAQRSGDGKVALVSFGDGATNIGSFHEACNLASLWSLPVIFLCQNNKYGEHTSVARHQKNPTIAQRATAYAMTGTTVDGNDPSAVYETISDAAERARSGGGPTLVEAVTYRLYGHVFGDRMSYMDEQELQEAWRAEPVGRFRARLIDQGTLSEDEAAKIEAEAASEVAAVLAEVSASAAPDVSELETDVVAPARRANGGVQARRSAPASTPDSKSSQKGSPDAANPPAVSVRQAINQALAEALRADERVVLLGEDISDTCGGGVFGVTRGLSTTYGEDRVRDAPISEQAIVGAAVGGAMSGLRPVAEVMFMDFLALCLDQLANHAAKLRYMSGGRTPVPMVLRTGVGGGLGVGAQHSQMLEAWLTHVPGLKVVVPSTSTDAFGLLLECIEDDDPCVFVEQVPLLASKSPFERRRIPLGSAEVKRSGGDVTVVTYGRQVLDALKVAEQLSDDGIDVEVLDLRTLAPLDETALIESVRRTRRAVVLHEAVVTGGFGGELAARMGESLFGVLRAPVLRVGATSTPLPYAGNLERLALPGTERLAKAVRATMSFESV